jgi:fucose permease
MNAKEIGIVGIGMMISPVAGGILSRRMGMRAPAILSGTMYALSLAVARWRTPETKSQRPCHQEKHRVTSISSSRGFMELFCRGRKLALLSLAFLIAEITNSTPPIYALFVKHRFKWEADMAGIWVTFYGLTMTAPSILTPKMIKVLGESRTVITAFCLHAVGTAMFALSRNTKLFWLGLFFVAPGNAKMNTLETVIQSYAASIGYGRGEILGHMGSLKAFASVILPLMHSRFFSYFISPDAVAYLPSIPWILCTLSSLVSACLFGMAVQCEDKKQDMALSHVRHEHQSKVEALPSENA